MTDGALHSQLWTHTVEHASETITTNHNKSQQPQPQIVDGLQPVPQERVQNRIREQIVDLPVPHIQDEIVDAWRPQRERSWEASLPS